MGQTALIPLQRKACCGFFSPEKSGGFGRVRTRDFLRKTQASAQHAVTLPEDRHIDTAL
jgi:hypothetical protein